MVHPQIKTKLVEKILPKLLTYTGRQEITPNAQ